MAEIQIEGYNYKLKKNQIVYMRWELRCSAPIPKKWKQKINRNRLKLPLSQERLAHEASKKHKHIISNQQIGILITFKE